LNSKQLAALELHLRCRAEVSCFHPFKDFLSYSGRGAGDIGRVEMQEFTGAKQYLGIERINKEFHRIHDKYRLR